MSTVDSITSPTAGNATTSGSANATNAHATTGMANTTTFLQLLVAQIKNQDPLQPTDGTAFLTQLAQFSQLEQLVGLRSDLSGAAAATGSTTTKTA